ncbi:prevent-host-death protein [Massilia sp. Root351]|uniref:type II toxin-antitoxin system prevent-host-death family antitoxin n=1 Tax=Massilia sp. Root351 TaxID=1736522 RepID=UPI00070C2FEA|nr:type II toxin-antitoxin system prevent-host-death family antitoxin [Massilia sp. Root351]KQV80905.1 prevent-host-death protein [Massilia sp. Root351]
MGATKLTSKEFDPDAGQARKPASEEPVFICKHGKPAYVLMSIAEFQRITSGGRTIADLLYMPEAAELDIEFPAAQDLARPAEFS